MNSPSGTIPSIILGGGSVLCASGFPGAIGLRTHRAIALPRI
ncbi:hypothetical protein [Oxynema aestuarii]|nr:hypothetical protein [Oxynema aestuarii]